MPGETPASSNIWAYLAFQEALDEARSAGVVRSDPDVEMFLRGFLAAWDRMARAVDEGRGWPPTDW